MVRNLSSRAKIFKAADHEAANTTTVTSGAIDTLGYRGCLIVTSFGTAAANNTVSVECSSDNSADTYAAISGTSVASGTSDEDVWVDVVNPPERYLKLVAARGTSTTRESVWAILYDPVSMPVDNTTSGTIIGELHVAPTEGTA